MCILKKASRNRINFLANGWAIAALTALPLSIVTVEMTASAAIALIPKEAIAQLATGTIGEIESLLDQGWQQMKASQFQDALYAYEQALSLSREIGDQRTEADALIGIGVVYSLLGDHYQSIDFQARSLAIYQEIGHSYSAAEALQGIGDSYWAIGNYPLAEDYLRQTLYLYQQLGDYEGEQYILGLLDQLLSEQ